MGQVDIKFFSLWPGRARRSLSSHVLTAILATLVLWSPPTFAREAPEAVAVPAPTVLQGPSPLRNLPLSRFSFHRGTVEPGQSISSILREHGVSYGRIHGVAESSKGVFDVRRLRTGRPYWIIRNAGRDGEVRYLVYEMSDLDYVVFALEDPPRVYAGKRAVETRIRSASGTIESSLWQALPGGGLNHELIQQLSDLFAWSIDFSHLRRGDGFRVIFEEKVVEGGRIYLGRILAARFTHRDEALYAFYFEHEGKGDYFDERGRSLRKAFLRAPVRHSRITSRYAAKRLHPILKRYRRHPGIDYAVPRGTPIMSVADGLVETAGYGKTNGKYVQVRHFQGYTTQYLHMSRFARGIRPGVRVKQGQVIGYVGSTGLATGPHVDLRIWKSGKPVDFSRLDLPAGEPVKKEWIPLFNEKITELKPSLDRET